MFGCRYIKPGRWLLQQSSKYGQFKVSFYSCHCIYLVKHKPILSYFEGCSSDVYQRTITFVYSDIPAPSPCPRTWCTSLITSDFQSRSFLFLPSFFNSALPAQRISTNILKRIARKMLHHIIRGRLFRVRKPSNGSMDALRACMSVAMLALILIFRCGELTSSLGLVQEAGR